MSKEQEIIFSVDGPVGRIHLNKAEALNALSLGMCQTMLEVLNTWRNDDSIQLVVVTSEGNRAFCAGGDVRQVALSGRDDPVNARQFFSIEYNLDAAINEFPKPYLCLIDGIVMGGGLGISVNGRYRVMGGNTVAAMPETGIGLLPDVGATRFLNDCPGRIGLYLGLTGARLNTADAIYAGFGTHYVPSDQHTALLNALEAGNYKNGGFEMVNRILEDFTMDAGESNLKASRSDIDRLFSEDDLEAIVSTLKRDQSELASASLSALDRMSPTSLKITARQLTQFSSVSVREALVLEYRLVSQVLLRPEFYEGIRAALIDKDRNPSWKPASLPDVTTEYIDGYFASIGDQELILN